jgi:CHASE2 domain-containing sensor protein
MMMQAAQRRAVRIPKTIGPYRVEELLASGGMGDVYLCVDDRLGKKVAVKVAHTDLAPHHDLINQIRDEGRRLASVKRNAYVARVLTAGDEVIDGVSVPYIAMEYEDGETLGGPKSNAWPIQKKVEVFTLVCKAVEALHEQHLVHADLKPSNIVLTGPLGDEPRLIDFGIARIVRRLGGERGQLCAGTPGYFDPAVGGTTGKKPDQRTDVYCLGLTLAAFLAGKEPTADEPSGWPSRGIPPSTECAAIDRELDSIMLRAIDPDPAKRWQSAADLRGALERWAAYRRTIPSRIGRLARQLRGTGAMVLERSRVAGVLLVAALATAIAFACSYPLFHVTKIGSLTQGIALRYARPPAELSSVRVIDASNDESFYAACKRNGVELPEVERKRRYAWAALADKLASVGDIKVVAFDIFFVKPDNDCEQTDPRLKSALINLARKCESQLVVLGMDHWNNTLAPTLESPGDVKVGWTGHYNDRQSSDPPLLHVALARNGKELADPSLALALSCAYLRPSDNANPRPSENKPTPHILLSEFWGTAMVKFYRESGGSNWEYLGKKQDLTLPDQAIQEPNPEASGEFGPGDLLALMPIIPPEQSMMDGVTKTAAQVLDMTSADLKSWIGNRAVIIGGAEDGPATYRERSFPRVYLHAIAFQQLTSGDFFHSPSIWESFCLTFIGGLIGGWIGAILAGRTRRSSRVIVAGSAIVAGLLGAAAVGAACVGLGVETRYFINPMIVMLATFLATFGVVYLDRRSAEWIRSGGLSMGGRLAA